MLTFLMIIIKNLQINNYSLNLVEDYKMRQDIFVGQGIVGKVHE